MIQINGKNGKVLTLGVISILILWVFCFWSGALFAIGSKLSGAKLFKGKNEKCISLNEAEAKFICQVTEYCNKILVSRYAPNDALNDIEKRNALLDELDQLETFIKSRTEEANAKSWMEYLGFDSLRKALSAEKFDLEPLRMALKNFNSGEKGLEEESFVHFRTQLASLIREQSHLYWSDQERKDFEEVCHQLPDDIKDLLTHYDPDLAEVVALSLSYLKANARVVSEAETLIQFVLKRFSVPNFQMAFSSVFLSQEAAQSFAESIEVSEIIRGSQVRGSGMVKGELRLKYIPNDKKAEIQIALNARLNTQTSAYQRGVQVNSSNAGLIRAEKSIYFDKQLTARPAQVAGRLSSNITGIFSGRLLGGFLIQHKVAEEQPFSQEVSRQRMEMRMAERLDKEVDSRIAPTQEFLDSVIYDGFEKMDLTPRSIRTNTSSKHLYWNAVFANKTQLGIPVLRERNNGLCLNNVDLSVALHASCPNNACFNSFSGKRLSDQDIVSRFARLFPQRNENNNGTDKKANNDKSSTVKGDPTLWFTFAEDLPIQIAFNNNQIEATLHLTEFEKDGKLYPELTIYIIYGIERSANGFTLRKIKVDARPGNLTSGQVIPARYQAIRTMILNRMEESLKPEYVIGTLDAKDIQLRNNNTSTNKSDVPPKGRMRLQTGTFVPVTFSSVNNWLNIGYKFVPEKLKK